MRPSQSFDELRLAEDLNEFSQIYLGISLAGTLLYIAILYMWKHRRFATEEDGLLALSSWPVCLRTTVPYLLTVSVLAPAVMIMLAQVAAFILTFAEDWSHAEAYAYQLGNLMHVEASSLHPSTGTGKVLDLLVAAAAMIFQAAFIGFSLSMGLVGRMSSFFPQNGVGFFGAIIDCFLLILFLCLWDSLFLWIIEGGDFLDSFLYMSGLVTGMHDQLTLTTPQTSGAKFWCVICLSSELSVVGFIVALIGVHPVMIRFAIKLEGKFDVDMTFDFAKAQKREKEKADAKIAAEQEALELEMQQQREEMDGVKCPHCAESKMKIRELEYRLEMAKRLNTIEIPDTPPAASRLNRQLSLNNDAGRSNANQDSPTKVDPRFSLSRTMSIIMGKDETREETGTIVGKEDIKAETNIIVGKDDVKEETRPHDQQL